MKKTLLTLSIIALAGSHAASGATLNLSFDLVDFTTDNGTAGALVSNNGSAITNGTVTLNVSGLSIDADGAANDSVSLVFNTTGTVDVGGTNTAAGLVSIGSGLFGVDDSRIDVNEQVIIGFNLASSSATLSGGGSSVISLNGFTGFTLNSIGNDGIVSINGTPDATSTANNNDYTFASTPSITALHTTDDADINNPRMQKILASVDVIAVPEPSSTILLGLGGVALIMRRRK